MKRKWAVYSYFNEYLGEFMLDADNKQEALAKAKLEDGMADKVFLVRPGGDLGTDGI